MNHFRDLFTPATQHYDQETTPSEPLEVLRRELAGKYETDVYLKRLAVWQRFDGHMKAQPPTLHPLFGGSKAHKDHPAFHLRGLSYNQLPLAIWQFEGIDPSTQSNAVVTVTGLRATKEWLCQDSLHTLRESPAALASLGLAGAVQRRYKDRYIDSINAYTATLAVTPPTSGLSPDVYRLQGQDTFYDFDTFITTEELREAGLTYTEDDLRKGGIGHKTRPSFLNGTFSAPIQEPAEISSDTFRRLHDELPNIERIYTYYSYLFSEQPRRALTGAFTPTTGKELFDRPGDETLTYIQANTLLDLIEHTTAPVPPERHKL